MPGLKKENQKLKWLVLICIAGLLAAIASCADAVDEEETAKAAKKVAPENVPTVGLDTCTNCHFGQTQQWLYGVHGNLNDSSHVMPPDELDADGFPSYDYFSDDTCAGCHDQLGDGRRLTEGYTGNVDRPVIGCESCHGGGANHYGIGEMPFPKPDYNRCGQCHNTTFPDGHLNYHPTGDAILEDYLLSPHLATLNEHVFEDGSKTDVRARCSRCHSDEGFRKYVDQVAGTTGHDEIVSFFDGKPAVEDGSPVQCSTCHDAHNVTPDKLERLPADTDTQGNDESRQFNTCTACHQLVQEDGTVLADAVDDDYAYHDPAKNDYGKLDEIITDTHAAVPGDTRLNTGASAEALYFIKKGDESSCAGCHNPHMADNTINEQYAESGHGDRLAEAWVHYDWKHISRSDCQRCHTSTGMKEYADCFADWNSDGSCDPADFTPADTTDDYDPAAFNSAFSIYVGWEPPSTTRIDGNDQNETLYCWACHTNYKGFYTYTDESDTEHRVGIRNPGQVTPPYPDMNVNGSVVTTATAAFEDLNESNVCMLCHVGREGGANVYDSTADFSDIGPLNSHYLSAGGQLFRTTGYEYQGRDYSNVSYFEHDEIGMTDSQGVPLHEGTGDNGPCVGCHMEGDKSHSFEPVDHSPSGTVTLTTDVCANCHSGQYAITGADLKTEHEEYFDALEALSAILLADGNTRFCPTAYPYFYPASQDCASAHYGLHRTDWVDLDGDTNPDGNGKDNMGAAFNLNLLHHDPGGYAHNRFYVKRLIYDSIDWMDDFALNDSTQGTLNGLPASAYKAGACQYLLGDDTCASGSRP